MYIKTHLNNALYQLLPALSMSEQKLVITELGLVYLEFINTYY